MSPRFAPMAFFASTLLLVGCTGGPAFTPVSGKVTKDGKALVGVSVNFQPNATMNPGPGSSARTDAEGAYELKVVPTDQPGAVVGPHKVYITLPGKARDPRDDRAPTSGFKPKQFDYTVPPGGTKSADFEYTKGQ